jgi:hypothetical protein
VEEHYKMPLVAEEGQGMIEEQGIGKVAVVVGEEEGSCYFVERNHYS